MFALPPPLVPTLHAQGEIHSLENVQLHHYPEDGPLQSTVRKLSIASASPTDLKTRGINRSDGWPLGVAGSSPDNSDTDLTTKPVHVAFKHLELRSRALFQQAFDESVGVAGQSRRKAEEGTRAEEGHAQRRVKQNRELRELGEEDQSTLEKSFEMPDNVENGIGGTWQGGPFGPVPQCPSSAKVLQIGIAVDAGYVKVTPRREVRGSLIYYTAE